MGRQARTKQADPAPLAGSSAHPHSGAKVGKKKAAAEAKSAREGKPQPARGGQAAAGQGVRAQKRARAAARAKAEQGSAEESSGDSEDEDDEAAFAREEAKGLEAARSALFNDDDLAEPQNMDSEEEELGFDDEDDLDRGSDSDEDEDEMDDEFDLEDGDTEGVTLDDFEMTAAEAEMMPASGKKAAKRAARAAAYNSDDEDDKLKLTGPREADKASKAAPEVAEGEDLGPTMSDLEDDDDEDEGEGDDDDSDNDVASGQLTDLRAVEKRMRSSARVLKNWKQLGASAGMSRSDLVEQLIGDVCQYHGYTAYLAEKLFDLFGVDEALEFFTTSDTPRPLTLRVNTLKTRRRDLAQALINRGVNLEPLEGGWSKVGLQVFSGGGVPVGATPEYLAGHYILQSASSFLPVIALGPKPHERVLDMSAAPGGKTTYMSALMGNTGEVWANDSSRGRIKGLGGNIARLGCRNVIITNVDGREYPKTMGGFDRVLLDAPCSGTGVISKDQSVKVNKTERDFVLLSHLQKQLVLCAIDSVTPNSATGGYVVYSTCSVTTEENEAVVSYALRKRPHVKLVETGLQFGKEGFQRFRGKEFGKNMHLTRRFYPHVHNMDGFYVAKFKVGKPEKKQANGDDFDGPAEPFRPLAESDEDGSDDDAQPSAFNQEEDAAIIADSRKRQLKQKGINPRADPSKAKNKAAVSDDEEEAEAPKAKKSRKTA